MTLLDRLPHLATAKIRTRASDGMGGYKDTYPTVVFTDQPCWRQPASDRQTTAWQQRGVDVTHRVYFASDPSLDERHVLEISGDRLEVASYAHPDDSVGLGVLWRVMVNYLERV